MKQIFCTLTITASLASPIILTSCSTSNSFVFFLSEPVNKGDPNKFVNSVKSNLNELDINKKFSNLNITYKISSNDLAKKQSLENGSGSFSFLKVQTLMNNNFYNDSNPLIQTLTTPFVFDTDMNKRYFDGSLNDPLRIIAKDMQTVSFGTNYEHPHSTWTDLDYQWNGIRYDKFYSKNNELVNGYRGMILLSGKKEVIETAKDYWDKKDWNNFRNLGIIVGNKESIGNYKLQELLIKQHFSLENTWTLASDELKNPDKYNYDEYGTELIGKNEKFIISFTDEASFAWTHRNKNTTGYTPIENSVIEILTVTNPSIYDIGTFSKYIDNELMNLMSQAIIKTYENNDNLYGEGLGYNGYKLINDFNSEVLNHYKNTFN